jgi:hypothetical protein
MTEHPMSLPPPNQQPPQWQAPTPSGQPTAGQPGPEQWVPQPAPKAKTGLGPQGHFKRAAVWRLERVSATPAEAAALATAGITDAAVQGYAAWRRSALFVAAPVVALTAVLAVVGFKDVETDDPITQLGVLAQILPLLGPVALAIGVAAGIANWTAVKKGSRALSIGWVLSVVLPLIPALMPIDWLLDHDSLVQLAGGDVATVDAILGLTKVELAVGYLIALLPILITFPGGVVRASLRAKGLLPSAALPGFFLVTTAPFYSLIVLVAVVLLIQFLGTGLLVAGAVLLALSPWVYVINRRHFIGNAVGDGMSDGLDKATKTNGWLSLAGLAAIVLWALTSKVQGLDVLDKGDGGWFDALTVGRTLAEAFARSFVTTVAFTHIFLSLTVTAWKANKAAADDPQLAIAEARHQAVASVFDEPQR